jgi:hypothetical protein
MCRGRVHLVALASRLCATITAFPTSNSCRYVCLDFDLKLSLKHWRLNEGHAHKRPRTHHKEGFALNT